MPYDCGKNIDRRGAPPRVLEIDLYMGKTSRAHAVHSGLTKTHESRLRTSKEPPPGLQTLRLCCLGLCHSRDATLPQVTADLRASDYTPPPSPRPPRLRRWGT